MAWMMGLYKLNQYNLWRLRAQQHAHCNNQHQKQHDGAKTQDRAPAWRSSGGLVCWGAELPTMGSPKVSSTGYRQSFPLSALWPRPVSKLWTDSGAGLIPELNWASEIVQKPEPDPQIHVEDHPQHGSVWSDWPRAPLSLIGSKPFVDGPMRTIRSWINLGRSDKALY